MSLRLLGGGGLVAGFPRVSGDEPPRPEDFERAITFSPRERG